MSYCTNVQSGGDSGCMQKSIIIGAVLSAAVVYVFGQDLYDCYVDNFYSDEQIVEHSFSKYDTVSQSAQNIQNVHNAAAEHNDYDLKNYIRVHNNSSYPFRSYYGQIISLLSEAQSNMTVLENELNRLNKRYAVLLNVDQQDTRMQLKKDYLLSAYTQIISQCKKLCDILCSMIEDLKVFEQRIASFEEYCEECARYECEQDSKWDNHDRHACKGSKYRKRKQCRKSEENYSDSFARTEKAVMQFNLDYY